MHNHNTYIFLLEQWSVHHHNRLRSSRTNRLCACTKTINCTLRTIMLVHQHNRQGSTIRLASSTITMDAVLFKLIVLMHHHDGRSALLRDGALAHLLTFESSLEQVFLLSCVTEFTTRCKLKSPFDISYITMNSCSLG